MKLCQDLAVLGRRRRPLVLVAGFFDGVHRGHQALLRRAVNEARRIGGTAWILTFDRHPLKVLAPESAPRLITAMPHKLRLFAALGLEGCVALPFSMNMASCEPEDFIAAITEQLKCLRVICVGRNWTFGRSGRGRPDLLRQLAGSHGFKAVVVSPVCVNGAPVSSTRVRQAVAVGRMADAVAMLGRPFSMLGTVMAGQRLGRRLGTPTANVVTADEVHPPPGVYAVRVLLGKRRLTGVANIGFRPTIDVPVLPLPPPGPPLLEVHIFDFNDDIYDRELEVMFERRVRPERRFGSPEELRLQIKRDIRRVRRWLV